MRMLRTELQKLFSGRIFLLILAAAFVLNAYLLFRTAQEAPPEDYRKVYHVLEGKPDEEKLDLLTYAANDFSGLYSFNFNVIYELQEECDNVVHYQEYLDSIDAQAKSMSSVSIFANPDTFNYRSIMRTPPAYTNMRDVQPVFDVSRGILLATENRFTDILCGLIVLFAVLSLMISDREQGMSGLLFSMKRGRMTLMLTKIGALAVTILLVTAAMYAENLIVGAYLYGLGDLSRPIQSVYGFIGCNLKISTGSYLVLYVLFKWVALFAVGAVLSLIAVHTKSTVPFYGISAAVLIVEGLTYALIHPLSIFSMFHYINLIAFTRGNEIFCNFKNINFFAYPVALIPASVGAVLLIAAVCGVLAAWLYGKKRNLEYRRLTIRLGKGRTEKVHSPQYYMLYKSMIMQKGLLVVLAFLAVAEFQSQRFVKQYDTTDAHYQHYANQLEGEITQQTYDFCAEERIRYAEIQAQINEMERSGRSYYEIDPLYREMAPSSGFNMLLDRIEQIESDPDAQIFYDTGYRRAFGKYGYDDDMKYALAAMLLCTFLISPLIANDNRCRMQYIIYATRSGRRQYRKRNILTACGCGMLAALLWMIPYAITVSQYYGNSGLHAPLRSITDFLEFPLDLTVLQYSLLVGIMRICGILAASLVMLWISKFCRNVTSAMLMNLAVFVLPILIYLLGSDFAVNIGFNALLSGNVLLNQFSVLQLIVPLGTAAILTFLTVNQRRKGVLS